MFRLLLVDCSYANGRQLWNAIGRYSSHTELTPSPAREPVSRSKLKGVKSPQVLHYPLASRRYPRAISSARVHLLLRQECPDN